jgi:LPS export ABC transporter protein LptC
MDHKHIERHYRLKNLKRASQIFVLGALILLVSGLAASRFVRQHQGDFQTSEVSGNGSNIENFTYSATGSHRWDLQAASAQVSDTLDSVKLTLPKVIYQGGFGGTIYLAAQSGNLDKKTGFVSAKGTVKISYKDFEFISRDVDYSDGSLEAATTAPVSLTGSDLKLTGKGLKLSVEKEEVLIEQEVKASLFNVKLIEPGRKLPM